MCLWLGGAQILGNAKGNEGYDYIHCRVVTTNTLVVTTDMFVPPSDTFKDDTLSSYDALMPRLCHATALQSWSG